MEKKYYLFLAVFALFFANEVHPQDTVCPPGLIHYWSLDKNNAGIFSDHIGNLNATTDVATTTVLGRVDSAQNFTGLSELNVPAHDDFNWNENSSFTFEFWVNKTTSCLSQNTSDNNVIIGRQDTTSGLHWWIGISCSDPGKVHITTISNDGQTNSLTSKKDIIDEDWHLITVVRDGNELTTSIFIDGQLDTSAQQTFTGDFVSEVPINLGWLNHRGKYHFNGNLDELAYYNVALNDSVIISHYNSGMGKNYCSTPDVDDTFMITLSLQGMQDHSGKNLQAFLRNAQDYADLDTVNIEVTSNDFEIMFDDLSEGGDFNIDLWIDTNENDMYDVPPADLAWRIPIGFVENDTTVIFQNNTDYTDIFDDEGDDSSSYQLTVNFSGFPDNIGQDLIVFLTDPITQSIVDSNVISIDTGDFTVIFDSLGIDNNYNIDFYTDVNGNGTYDIPPVDYAWRIEIPVVNSDTTVMFSYDTIFTDIGLAVSVGDVPPDEVFSIYPNPVKQQLNIKLFRNADHLSIFDLKGQLVMQKSISKTDQAIRLDVSSLNTGMYIVTLSTNNRPVHQKFIKE